MGAVSKVYGIKYSTPKSFKEEGILNVNNINIHFTLTNDFFNCGEPDVSHIEFRSQINGRENAISETGYKSHFYGVTSNEFNEYMINNWQALIIETIETIKREEIFVFHFDQGQEKEVAIQGTLFS